MSRRRFDISQRLVASAAAATLGVALARHGVADDQATPPAAAERAGFAAPGATDAAGSHSAGTPIGANRQEKEAAEAGKLRLREGTELKNVIGRFRQVGDTLTFIDGQNREIGGLPNLNLERVSRVLQTVEEPESVSWSISGRVTEYSGRNFLLISRAVFRSAAPPPPPESVAQEPVKGAP
ncbi:hypothetical protein [Lacipirellula sp.]|uniref:hypothetical protein n=1 Tax=Lacipirellula sp. TaxID=2691419 RepID=UPI003D0CE1B3